MIYRDASINDFKKIAQLHAESWCINYRGIYSEVFLSKDVVHNRLAVWEKRLLQPTSNQKIILAEEDSQLYGFICVYGQYDFEFGTFVDNLHVKTSMKGQGIG